MCCAAKVPVSARQHLHRDTLLAENIQVAQLWHKRTHHMQNRTRIAVPVLYIMVLSCLMMACGAIRAPVRKISTPSDFPLELLQIPQVLQKGEVGTVAVKTAPGNTCNAEFGYYDAARKWRWIELPQVKANNTGTCSWDWTVPQDASTGVAELRVGARDQTESDMLAPQTICIERCPWSNTPQP